MTQDTYDHETHQYTQRGIPVPSVTKVVNIISPLPYIKKEDLEWLRVRGTAVHAATELLEAGDLDWDSLDDRIRPHVEAWQKFLERTGFETLHKEVRVDHYGLGYAGRLDRIGYFPTKRGGKPRLAIVDIKSGEVTIGAGPQTAGYTMAWNSEKPPHMQVRDRYAVRLSEDGVAHPTKLADPNDFRTFEAGLVILRWRESK